MLASRRTLHAYTTPSSVLTRCSSVRSLLPGHTADFHLEASFGAGLPDSFFSPLEREPSTDSPNSRNFPRYGPPHDLMERVYIVSPGAKNEPSGMLNNPFHQCSVSGWSVLRAVLKCCQHCTHLSVHLFFESFPLILCSDLIVWESFG